jgi:hypothetical protein
MAVKRWLFKRQIGATADISPDPPKRHMNKQGNPMRQFVMAAALFPVARFGRKVT